ncbi:unnamed protein product [Cylicostephanus goldi]|uniref:Lipid-binding serum glycoprotein C-terminal domain-containing protein n=1 Tax=Cylicostephanus goldi TaxID=71465 RepID=A0A3P6SI49_CYLGO|nr:unnamed protein product [Cylicostephanus goldi]
MMQTIDVPHVYMTAKDGITIGGQFALNMYIDPMQNNTTPLASIILNGTMSLTPLIVNRKLSAKVFLAVFETIFSKVTKFLINDVLKVGIPIPSFANVTISGKLMIAFSPYILRIFGISLNAFTGFVNENQYSIFADATEIRVFDKCVRTNIGFELEAI